ncbi:hypothetical protein DPMN_123664 [Dreissena polymorpha]|uniref:Uncharacterized protein n=1 Tax=Dreissena polymorpha TaxID=45954 RepID=A0A9D4GQS6_DREPO|nr:hypothetical protein DPMN_123664 [Dreissena polymorpha]
MASHNAKYYSKKPRKRDAKGCSTISSMFAKIAESSTPSSNPEQAVQASEIPMAEPVPLSDSVDNSSAEPSKKVVVQSPSSSSSNHNAFKYEMKYQRLYHSSAKGWLLCKYCELFPSGKTSECIKLVDDAV